MTTTAKRPYSAAVTARTLSRILSRSGFTKADTSNRYRWTDGFYVHRIGYSSTVSVDYHLNDLHSYSSGMSEEARAAHRSKVDQMREALFECGYVSSRDDLIYIECQHE